MFKRLLLVLLLLLAAGMRAAAEDRIATGLNNPRHISFGPDGTLYIAEAGSGGSTDAQGPYGPVKIGATGQVSAVAVDGTQSVVISALLSTDAGFGQIEGVGSVYVTDESYWLVMGLGPQDVPDGQYVEALVEVDRATGDVKQMIDLRAFEVDNNPDEADEIVSNPIDIAVSADGIIYIADASANAVLAITNGEVQLFAAWPPTSATPSAVPTSVAVAEDGSVYIGFLSGFPFPPGGARIEQWSPDGTLLKTFGGLTLVTDILIGQDGSLYAVEMASGFGDLGYNAHSGRVVQVTDDGLMVLMDGLNIPYGMAQDAAGNLYVTVNSAFAPLDAGLVIAVTMDGAHTAQPASTPEVIQPVSTPEV